MISEADRKYKDVQNRKSIVERDKVAILKTIEDLDAKKVLALEKTYAEVNKVFGNLYSKFLPGANATLSKVNGNILDGLEIRVCFGEVWKESLTELSGGQRSLMALSLILSLCRYKAAPLYILDEIDAALDNSHTENIGDIIGKVMWRKRRAALFDQSNNVSTGVFFVSIHCGVFEGGILPQLQCPVSGGARRKYSELARHPHCPRSKGSCSSQTKVKRDS